MLIIKFKNQKLYTSKSVTKETLTDSTCLFSHPDGNSQDCFFVSEWAPIRDAGGVILEEQNQLKLF